MLLLVSPCFYVLKMEPLAGASSQLSFGALAFYLVGLLHPAIILFAHISRIVGRSVYVQ
jgi:hypothetical protein